MRVLKKKINPSFRSQTEKNTSSRRGIPYRRYGGGKSKTCKNNKV